MSPVKRAAPRAPTHCYNGGVHTSLTLIVIVVGTALFFDYTNGFHDTANAMATTIATRALKPRLAVTLASILNFAGAFISVSVAATIASGIVEQNLVTVPIVFAGLVGAIVWNLVDVVLQHPVVLVARADRRRARRDDRGRRHGRGDLERHPREGHHPRAARAVHLRRRRLPRDAALASASRGAFPSEHASRGFRLGQIASSSLVALAHGTNDAQKTMGVVTLTLIAGGRLGADEAIPFWVKLVVRRGDRARARSPAAGA